MASRRGIVAGVAAIVVFGLAAAAVAIAAAAPTGTTVQGSPNGGDPTPFATPGRSSAPTASTTGAATAISGDDGRVLDYLASLPTVHDVTPDTVGEFTDLVCTTLRSAKMSPSFYQQVVAIEKHGYSLSDAQATGLLRTVAQSGCPDAVRVVDSAGGEAAGPAPSPTPGN